MLIRQLALVSETEQIPFSEVARISASLLRQIARDFNPIWGINATIAPFDTLEHVPAGFWPLIIRDDIGIPGAAGIHLDRNGQPYALVQASENTPLTCSHECLEMLADPYGDQLVASDSIKQGQGRVLYLLEVCDPSEDKAFGYRVDGVLLSDFYTPHFFDPVPSSPRFSFTGAIKKPKQVLKGGYLSWMVPETREWWQAKFFGPKLEYVLLGVLAREQGRGWREIIDAKTFEPVEKLLRDKLSTAKAAAPAQAFFSPASTSASSSWATTLREDIAQVLAEAKQ